MADTPISGLVSLTTVNANASDLLVVVDVTDTTMSVNGSDKQITWGNFLAASAGDVTYSGFNSTVGKVGGKTVTLAGNLSTVGANSLAITTTGPTAITFPTSGTLITNSVATLSSLNSIGTVTTGTWNGTAITPTYGGTGLATLTANAVMVGNGTGVINFATVGTAGRVLADQGAAANPAFTSTGLELDSFASVITSDTFNGTLITLNAAVSNWHTITLNSNTTLAVASAVNGQQFTVVPIQSNGGSCFITWWNGIKWAGGSPPTLTTTNAKADILTFKQYGTNSYYGMVAGQNF